MHWGQPSRWAVYIRVDKKTKIYTFAHKLDDFYQFLSDTDDIFDMF